MNDLSRASWWMNVNDILTGHDWLGFDYEMSGDERPQSGGRLRADLQEMIRALSGQP